MDKAIIIITVFFLIIAAIDKCLGGRWGMAQQMDAGLSAMAAMFIPMIGMLVLTPVLSELAAPIVIPFFRFLHADPAIFATSVLACDMGGYPMAIALADTREAGLFAGCIYGCISLGGCFTFILPVGIGLVYKEKLPDFSLGVLCGIATIPIGCIFGGFAANFSAELIFTNGLPIFGFSLLVILGILKAREISIRIFVAIGRITVVLSSVGFAVAVVSELCGITIIPGMLPLFDAGKVVFNVGIVLAGTFPMIYFLRNVLNKPIAKVGAFIGADEAASVGILAGVANIMPILSACNKMSRPGLIIATAFSVSGSCMLGDHLAYISVVEPDMIVPMLAAKTAGAVSAVVFASYMARCSVLSKHLCGTKSIATTTEE